MTHVQKIRFFYNFGSRTFFFHLGLPLVYIERSRTGYFHCHLDSRNIHLRNLLQTLRLDEQKKMTFNLLYVAIIIFTLLIIGLILTVMDFMETERSIKLAAEKKSLAKNISGMAVDPLT